MFQNLETIDIITLFAIVKLIEVAAVDLDLICIIYVMWKAALSYF